MLEGFIAIVNLQHGLVPVEKPDRHVSETVLAGEHLHQAAVHRPELVKLVCERKRIGDGFRKEIESNLTVVESLPQLVVVLLLHGCDPLALVLQLVSLLHARHEKALHVIP